VGPPRRPGAGSGWDARNLKKKFELSSTRESESRYHDCHWQRKLTGTRLYAPPWRLAALLPPHHNLIWSLAP
jgi:hypothetical protein